jgi:septal ring factor EnvC (AmiA/AmiB activator)
VEQISPTGPEAPSERDELRSTKDDLLKKITKVDREIAKAESQIAKLKKKQQELEDLQANKHGMSDTNEEEEEERPKNQSIAQIIYADNRVRRFPPAAVWAPPNPTLLSSCRNAPSRRTRPWPSSPL